MQGMIHKCAYKKRKSSIFKEETAFLAGPNDAYSGKNKNGLEAGITLEIMQIGQIKKQGGLMCDNCAEM
jgi:hypothetical protein